MWLGTRLSSASAGALGLWGSHPCDLCMAGLGLLTAWQSHGCVPGTTRALPLTVSYLPYFIGQSKSQTSADSREGKRLHPIMGKVQNLITTDLRQWRLGDF